MANAAIFAILLTLLSPGPVCDAANAAAQRSLTAEVNLARLAAGLPALTTHPVICAIAAERAAAVAASGSTEVNLQLLNRTTRELYRRGYQPHAWGQTALILNPGDSLLERWRDVKPDSYSDSVEGDFEHLGIGISLHKGRPVYAVVVALPKRSVEWRRAAPLRDLERVRADALAEVNRVRERRGRPVVRPNDALDRAAQRHAEELFRDGAYSHIGADGSNSAERARSAGYRGARLVTENIAKGLFEPREVVERWMNSRGHRRNILHPEARETGLGVAFGESVNGFEVVWVQILGSRGG